MVVIYRSGRYRRPRGSVWRISLGRRRTGLRSDMTRSSACSAMRGAQRLLRPRKPSTSVRSPITSYAKRSLRSGSRASSLLTTVSGHRRSSRLCTSPARRAWTRRALRKDVWSQAAAPFLLVVTPEKVELCNGFEPPSASSLSLDFDPRSPSLPEALANFSSERISSSITWSDLEIHGQLQRR